ncbi:hypothetical protein J2848_006631 [Azospirillum lipoferum]|uniref:Uncharacterized protein n=1 Tax=Azospirillum lipoferum TaxID=193 RepID=A0A5A9GDL2_AZOLI|nr:MULTISPECIES: hypothetical protein [Azospirillum]KAA0591692.1 hypothetical protein FZ942_30390 [Azospirillum lipoferum]MCP1614922.1 hypothetical protein [Azospirillum lipoferum]MDW5536327.1 hypothetical protein [Azospirillum sp. NL1]
MDVATTDLGATLIALAVPAVVTVLFGVAAILAMLRRGLRRLYWAGCAMLIGVGSAGTVAVVCCASPTILADGSISGEMPPAFGAALMLAAMGCGGAVLGLVGLVCSRWSQAVGAAPK